VFDLQEEPLDEVALTVERIVAGHLWGCFSGRDHGNGVLFGDGLTERLGIIAFVTEDMMGWQIGDQGFGLGDVTDLPRREDEPQGVAQSIDDCVDLGGQPAPRAADRASFRPPFLPAACWCARTIVESIMMYSKSGSSAIAANNRSQTPSLDHREKRTKTLFQLPKLSGRSRQGTPVLASQSIASTNKRLSAPVRPGSLGLPGKCGRIRSHWWSFSISRTDDIQRSSKRSLNQISDRAGILNVNAL
jgi:hypothetical protein